MVVVVLQRTETRGKLEDEKEGWKKQKGRMESPRAWEVARHGRERRDRGGRGKTGGLELAALQ